MGVKWSVYKLLSIKSLNLHGVSWANINNWIKRGNKLSWNCAQKSMSNEHGSLNKKRKSETKANQHQINIYHLHFPPLPCHLHMDCEPTVSTYEVPVSRWLPYVAYVKSIMKLVGDVASPIMLLFTLNWTIRCWNQYEMQTHNRIQDKLIFEYTSRFTY